MFDFRENHSAEPGPGREALIAFVRAIHGLDLGLWNRLGHWDRNYRPFSYFDGDEVVANVCVYSLDMVVGGQRKKVAQISGVGTREDLRRRGLSRELTARAMDWARGEGHHDFFLFADVDARPFYQRIGFSPAEEYRPWVAVESTLPRTGARKLDMDVASDRQVVVDLARRRAPVSMTLGVQAPGLLIFHALYPLRDHLYHLPKLNAVVAVRRSDWGLVIEDVIAEQIPSLEQMYPYLCGQWDLEVRFGFVPDRLGLTSWNTLATDEHGLFLFAPMMLPEGRLFFPATAHA